MSKITPNTPEAQPEIVFEACGTFQAYYKAETWIRENGFSAGSMCRDEPIGLIRYPGVSIAKWKNLSLRERKSFDALLLPMPDFREGGCKIVFQKAVAV